MKSSEKFPGPVLIRLFPKVRLQANWPVVASVVPFSLFV